jgi:hypothetical protein
MVWAPWNLETESAGVDRMDAGERELCVRRPSGVEDVRVVVVSQGRADKQEDGVEGEDDFAQHCQCRNGTDTVQLMG